MNTYRISPIHFDNKVCTLITTKNHRFVGLTPIDKITFDAVNGYKSRLVAGEIKNGYLDIYWYK